MIKIKPEDVAIGIAVSNWEEAIKESSKILLERGAIQPSYITAMIQSVKENGPYIVISKNIALAHARPEFGVNQLGVTFSTLAAPVDFGSKLFDPVKLIITLAAKTSADHLELLSGLASVLSDEELVDRLFSAPSPEIFSAILSEYS